jgi:hypothetical protein
MPSDKKKNFYKKYYADVVKATEGTGLFPEMVIAQMALESSWGTSGLATKANNMFGVKSHGEKDGIILQNKKEGKDVSWKKYKTPLDSINGYVKFLQDNPRYKKGGVLDAKTPQEQANLLQKAGYAGDSTTYANKIISTIENKENANYVKSLSTEKAEKPIVSGNSWGDRFVNKIKEAGEEVSEDIKKTKEKQAESYQNIQDEFPGGEYGRGGDLYVLPDGRIFSYDGKMGTYDRETKRPTWTHDSYTAGKNWEGTPGYGERQAKKDKITAEDAAQKAQEQADIDKYGEEGTLITEGPLRGGTRFSDSRYKDIYGDDVYEGTTKVDDLTTTTDDGGVNIQDLADEESSTATGVVKQSETRQDIERRIQDNKDLLNNLGNRPEFVHDYAPDQQKSTNLINNITDAGRIAMGGIAASTEIPIYERGDMFQTSMNELTDRRNIGLTDTEKDFARNMAERGYGYDVKNIAKFAGGSAGVALGNLGRATGQLYDEYGKLAVRDEGVRRQNRADFNRGALSDEQVNRQIFTDELRQTEMTKQAGAALVQDATKDIKDRKQYNKAYGKGSQMYEYMKSIDRDKQESIFNQDKADKIRVDDSIKTSQRALEDDTLKLENYGGITPDTVLGGDPTATEGLKTVEELQQMKKDGTINDEVYQERLKKLDTDVEMPDDFIPVSAATQATPEVETVSNSGVDSRSKAVAEEAVTEEVVAEEFNPNQFAENGVPKIDERMDDNEFNEEWTPKDQANIDASFEEKVSIPGEVEAQQQIDEGFDAASFSDEIKPEDNIKDYEAELEKNPETLKKYKEDPIAFLEDDIKGWESEPDSEKKTKSLKNLKKNLKFLKAAKEAIIIN